MGSLLTAGSEVGVAADATRHRCKCLGRKYRQGAEDYTPLRKPMYNGQKEADGPLKETDKQDPEKLGRNKESVLSWQSVKETISRTGSACVAHNAEKNQAK